MTPEQAIERCVNDLRRTSDLRELARLAKKYDLPSVVRTAQLLMGEDK